MIHPRDVRDLIVAPALHQLDLYSLAAEQLVMGTAAAESGFRYLRQIGGGPALGLWQMEPATYIDLINNYLFYKTDLRERLMPLQARVPAGFAQLPSNHMYAAAMCRVHYRRFKAPLPPAGAVERLGEYWKKYYNTEKGAGTFEHFVEAYNEMVAGLYE